MPVDLSGVWAKIGRGKEHAYTVQDEVARWMDERPYALTTKGNADFTRLALVINVLKLADLQRWTLIIGDAVNNLRSALDHLVYAIGIYESGQNPPPNEKRLAFPICDKPEDFPGAAERIKTLSSDVRTAIESVQPYKRPHPTLPGLLSMLRDFNNTDKHKLLHLAYAASASGELSFRWEGSRDSQPIVTSIEANIGQLEDGAEVIAVTVDRSAPDMHCDVTVVNVIIALWHGAKPGVNRPGADRDDFSALLHLITAEVEEVVRIVSSAVKS
jgi:hypothetical protein